MTHQPGLTPRQKRNLRTIFPGEQILFAPEQCLIFGTDSSRLFAPPWAVVRPEDTRQVQDLLQWAQKEQVPIIPRSRGTNMVGACVPKGGGVVVSSLCMDRVLEIDSRDFVAVVEPGVVTADLQAKLSEKKLFYPPDPASVKFSTIGGNVSTNAGGMRAVKYGVTGDYVLGLEVVLPGGEVIHTGGRCHKDVVGLDLTSLFVGSEGSLGFITKIWLKLLPLPQASGTVMLAFDSLAQALETAERIMQSGILPVTMELMNEEVLDAVRRIDRIPCPSNTAAVLLVKVDGTIHTVKQDMLEIQKLSSGSGHLLTLQGTGEEEESLWELRRMINPASFQVRPDKMSEDVCVPRGSVLPLLEGVREISHATGVPILTFGHLGDGNIHTNIMYDRQSETERTGAHKAKEQLMDLVLGLRGSLSGEHGVGLAKRPFVDRQLGNMQLSLMQGIKRVFDPQGIMNPGKGF